MSKKKGKKKPIKRGNNKQKQFTQGKREGVPLKTQVAVDKKTKQVICSSFVNGKPQDFRLFKESTMKIHPDTKIIADIGYEGIHRLHVKSELPKKKTKKSPSKKRGKEEKPRTC